jgi:PKD repeat protein
VLAGVVLALLAAGRADAATYCVEPRAGCADAAHETIASALAAAAANPGGDRVLLGLATYSEVVLLQGDVELEGLGRDASILTTATTAPALTVAPGARASGLGVELVSGIGIDIAGTVEDVAVKADEAVVGVIGMQVTGTARDAHVEVPGPRTIGVRGTGGGVLEDSTVTAQDAIQDVATVRRTSIVASGIGLGYNRTATGLAEDVLVRALDRGVTGVYFAAQDVDAVLTLRHVTISGAGTGVRTLATGETSGSTVVQMADSVVHETGTAVHAGFQGGRASTVHVTYSSLSGVVTEPGGAVNLGAGVIPAPAQPFASGDPEHRLAFRPAWDSPLRNAGTPGVLGALESATDMAGNPRLVETRRDMGAFEYQNLAPSAGIFLLFPAGTPGTAVSAETPFEATDPDGDPVTLTFDWGDGSGDADATHTYAQEGRFLVRLVARDALGNESAVYSRTIGIAAGPTTFCVAPRTGCPGGDLGSVADAQTAAAGNGDSRDRVELGEATYGPIATASPVEIVGEGHGLTIVRGADGGDAILAEKGMRVAGLTALAGDKGAGITLGGGAQAEDVEVRAGRTCSVETGCVDAVPAAGIVIGADSRAARAVVQIPLDSGAAGVVGTGPGSLLEDSTVEGSVGALEVETVRRSRVSGLTAIRIGAGQRAHLDNLLVQPVGKESVGVRVSASDASSTLVAQHLTILGRAEDPDVTGLVAEATASGAPATASVELTSSLVREVDVPLSNRASSDPGFTPEASIAVDHSSLDIGDVETIGPGEYTLGEGNIPLAGGPLQDGIEPLPGSPLIDAGAPLHEGDSTTDLLGRPRVNGPLPDIGAVEHQGDAPAVTVAAPASALVGERVTFTATGSDPDAGDALTYAWTFDDGTTATGATVSRTFAAGARSATVTVTDRTGRTGSATAAVDVKPPSAPATSAPPSIVPNPLPSVLPQLRDTKAPVLGKLAARVTRRRGTYTSSLSEAAEVVLTLERPRSCRRVRGKRRCTPAKTIATKTVDARAGKLTIRLAKRLAKGRYAAELVAIDAAGNESAPRRISVRVR